MNSDFFYEQPKKYLRSVILEPCASEAFKRGMQNITIVSPNRGIATKILVYFKPVYLVGRKENWEDTKKKDQDGVAMKYESII